MRSAYRVLAARSGMRRAVSLRKNGSSTQQCGVAALHILIAIVVFAIVAVVYFSAVLNWNYSTGERAGWVQKLSQKGWICKTWEGELSMIAMPGSTPEKFYFTVWDDAVAQSINGLMGKRVAMHYEEKVGLPTSCFGETRYYVTKVTPVAEIPFMPGVMALPPTAPPAAGVPSAPDKH